ncbi:RNA polymerase sigma factor [Sulfuriferula thiophila]|uniref:RNA polymerase sigma factor n=1 Tax=Sulfuriferula thiophila TaxID=1781211 RepID=UPI000F614725|nr:sigma-70 family RNA polymerase sigma factor [Sulfuriferula thiophila]
MTIFKHPIIEHIPSLRRYARALLGGRAEDADDLVQDTLERAYAKWHLWNVGAKLRPWLFSIMHNLFINQVVLLKNRAAHVSLDDAMELSVIANPGARLEAMELVHAVSRLPESSRTVLLLVTLEDFSYADTAKILDIPIGTVMSRLARARQQLRNMLSDTPQVELKVMK